VQGLGEQQRGRSRDRHEQSGFDCAGAPDKHHTTGNHRESGSRRHALVFQRHLVEPIVRNQLFIRMGARDQLVKGPSSSKTYLVAEADQGYTLYCEVTAFYGGHEVPARSQPFVIPKKKRVVTRL